jgi:hypothetical protein
MTRQTTHVDPAELHHNPAFTQGVIAPATAISVLIVADLAVPGALVEVDAIALIP